jgi:hypothetical protein
MEIRNKFAGMDGICHSFLCRGYFILMNEKLIYEAPYFNLGNDIF